MTAHPHPAPLQPDRAFIPVLAKLRTAMTNTANTTTPDL
jgi:hypothetical protein